MKSIVLKFSFISILALALFSACSSEAEPAGQAAEAVEYYCPMHCEGDKVYHEPGNCPVCGMELSKREVKVEHLDMTSPES